MVNALVLIPHKHIFLGHASGLSTHAPILLGNLVILTLQVLDLLMHASILLDNPIIDNDDVIILFLDLYNLHPIEVSISLTRLSIII